MKKKQKEREEVKLRISRDDNNGMFFFFIGFRLHHGTEVYSAINLTAIVKNIILKKNISNFSMTIQFMSRNVFIQLTLCLSIRWHNKKKLSLSHSLNFTHLHGGSMLCSVYLIN